MFPCSLQESTELAPGQLLAELERRQDEVLLQLDELESKLALVLGKLGIEMEMGEVS